MMIENILNFLASNFLKLGIIMGIFYIIGLIIFLKMNRKRVMQYYNVDFEEYEEAMEYIKHVDEQNKRDLFRYIR